MFFQPFISVFFILFLLGCARPVSKFPAAEIIPSINKHEINLYEALTPLHVLYLGCGHLAIQYRNESIIIDPFFSTQGFTQRKIKSDINAFHKYASILSKHDLDLSTTRSIWIAHTHYDHMMDIPVLFQQGMISPEVIIYGNEFGDDILSNFTTQHQYRVLHADDVYFHKQNNNIPQWINGAASVKVMPVLSGHAPHYKVGPLKIHLMQGELEASYFKEHYRDTEDVTKRKQWQEGCTYSFLIDFMEDTDIQFRIFVQTSASKFPLGKPPEAILKQRKVDVAFLCVASANYVKPYPVDILKFLQPEKVVFIHWEDFFLKPLAFDSAKLVRFTNFKKIYRVLERNNLKPTQDDYVMPRPGTMITIR